MQRQQLLCDHCGQILRGMEKNAERKEEYIQIRGELSVQYWDKENDKPGHFFVTPAPGSTLIFCDVDCLKNYIEWRRDQAEERGWFANQNGYNGE